MTPIDVVRIDAATWAAVGWLVLKITVVAGAGRLALLLMPRASAATRHAVAVATLATAVSVPLATLVLPAWSLRVLPPAQQVAVLPRPDASPLILDVGDRSDRVVRVAELASKADADEPLTVIVNAPAKSSPTLAMRATEPVAPTLATRPWLDAVFAAWPALTLLLVMVVAAVLVSGLVFACLASRLLAWRAAEAPDERLRLELEDARQHLGVRDPVELKLSRRVAVPMVSGLFRPVLLMPLEALDWSAPRLRAVYLHELAHVLRRDAWSLVLCRLATSLYWFHPVVWMLDRVARRECERACDDMVLGAGVRASDYAEHLLAIARGTARPAMAGVTLSMATRSSLEGRLLMILNPSVRRDAASRRALVAAGVVALALLVPLASMRVVAAPYQPVVPMPSIDPIVMDGAGAASDAMDPIACDDATDAVSTVTAEADDGHINTTLPSTEFMMELAGSKSGSQWWNRGHDLYHDDSFYEAGLAYDHAARAGHRPEVSFYNAACSYALANRKTLAIGALRNALNAGFDDARLLQTDSDLNSIRSDTRFRLLVDEVMESGANMGERKSARWTYNALKTNTTADADEWSDAGIRLMRAGETDLAIDAFQRQIKMDGSATGMYNLACAYALDGNDAAAFQALERAILAGYGDSEKFAEDADLATLQDKPELTRLSRMADDLSLWSKDGDYDGFNSMKKLWNDDRDGWKEQMDRLEDATRRYPEAGRAWFNLGYAQLRVRDNGAARDSYLKAVKLGYRPQTSSYNLACAYAQLKDANSAMQWLEKAEDEGMELGHYLVSDRDLDPIRGDARFRAMRDRLRWHNNDKHKYKVGSDQS